MALHTLNRPPSDHGCLSNCLSAISPGDELILIEDAVYHALPAHISALSRDGLKIWVLEEDARARGISMRISEQASTVDSHGFVALSCAQDKVVSWF